MIEEGDARWRDGDRWEQNHQMKSHRNLQGYVWVDGAEPHVLIMVMSTDLAPLCHNGPPDSPMKWGPGKWLTYVGNTKPLPTCWALQGWWSP